MDEDTRDFFRQKDRAYKIGKLRDELVRWEPRLRAQIGLAALAVALAFVLLAVGVGLGDWFFTGAEETATSVTCDDDYNYEEEDGLTVEAFTDANGTPCWRETRVDSVSVVHHWPAGVAFPVYLLMLVACFLVGVGGFGGGIVVAVGVFTEWGVDAWRHTYIEERVRKLEEQLDREERDENEGPGE